MLDRSTCPGSDGAHHPSRIGTRKAYNGYGCRCDDAREATRLYRTRHRQGRLTPAMVDGTAAARMLQALSTGGWPNRIQAARAGIDRDVMRRIRANPGRPITRRSHHAITRLYRELSHIPGGDTRATNWALKQGYAPATAWDPDTIGDPTALPQHDAVDTGQASVNEAVDFALLLQGKLHLPPSPYRHQLHLRAITELARRTHPDGTPKYTTAQTAALLHITPRSAERLRAEVRRIEQEKTHPTPTREQTQAA